MKQQLWIVNSSLLGIFFVALAVSQLLQKEAPPLRIKKIRTELLPEKREALSSTIWEKIYKDDIFGTFVPTVIQPALQDLVTPVPEPTPAAVTPAPEPPKQEFIEPLTLTVTGIIVSADEASNIAMIEDETKKEELYHVGDRIKDAQVIKIVRERVVLLRANGQQEVFFLRKDDEKIDPNSPDRWKYIVKKINDFAYEIDPQHFKQEVESLGNFIERASVIGTAYQSGKIVGLKIGSLLKNDVGVALGLKDNDILISINNLDTADIKNRIQIYDAITQKHVGDSITALIKRDGKEETLTYTLATMSKAKKQLFAGKEPETKKAEEPLKMSRLQEREKLTRDFKDRHGDEQQREAITKIRQRLLENLRSRLQNARVR